MTQPWQSAPRHLGRKLLVVSIFCCVSLNPSRQDLCPPAPLPPSKMRNCCCCCWFLNNKLYNEKSHPAGTESLQRRPQGEGENRVMDEASGQPALLQPDHGEEAAPGD